MHIFSYAFCSGSSCSLLESTYRFSLAPAQGSYALETLIPRKNNALSFWVSHIFIFPSSSNTWVAPPSSFSASVPAPRAHHPWTHYRVRHPCAAYHPWERRRLVRAVLVFSRCRRSLRHAPFFLREDAWVSQQRARGTFLVRGG